MVSSVSFSGTVVLTRRFPPLAVQRYGRSSVLQGLQVIHSSHSPSRTHMYTHTHTCTPTGDDNMELFVVTVTVVCEVKPMSFPSPLGHNCKTKTRWSPGATHPLSVRGRAYLGGPGGAAVVGLADHVVDDHLGDLPRHLLLRLQQSATVRLRRGW